VVEKSPSPQGRVGTPTIPERIDEITPSPSPQGRVGTLDVASQSAAVADVAVPSGSGRNKDVANQRLHHRRSPSPQGRVGTKMLQIRDYTTAGRRPLRVGSEPGDLVVKWNK